MPESTCSKNPDELKKKECCGGCEKSAHLWGRRNLLVGLGWLSMITAGVASATGLLRFMFPKVLFEPSLVFKAGYPYEYAAGTVDTRWVRDQRVWIVRDTSKLYALSAICTHLGCTPVWLNNEDKFKCPCHGSGFYRTGVNYEGPAPRALERVRVYLAEDGQIVVDKSKKFTYERHEWDIPESYIVV